MDITTINAYDLALYALRVGVFSRHVHTPMVG